MARFFANLFPSGLKRQRLAVGPVRSHGVQSVRDGEDSRSERNILPLSAARISRAVVAFMMSADDLSGRGEESHAAQKPVSDQDVRPHHGFFFLREDSFFQQDD